MIFRRERFYSAAVFVTIEAIILGKLRCSLLGGTVPLPGMIST
jgi:hypothetical protein